LQQHRCPGATKLADVLVFTCGAPVWMSRVRAARLIQTGVSGIWQRRALASLHSAGVINADVADKTRFLLLHDYGMGGT
jgi:hypothetical protein